MGISFDVLMFLGLLGVWFYYMRMAFCGVNRMV